MSDARTVRAGAVMAGGTVVSRALGFVNRSLLTVLLGAAAVDLGANAFAVANTLPNTIYLLVAGGVLNAVLVPQIVRASADADGGRAYLDRLITMGLALLLVVTVGLTLAAAPLIRLYAEGFTADQEALAVAFALWCIPQVFFYGAYTLLGQVLNANGSFGPYTWAPVANNVVAIAGMLTFLGLYGSAALTRPADWSAGMVALLAATATLGVVAQALVLVLPLRRIGYRWRPRWGVRGMGLRTAGSVAAWTFAAVVAGQLTYLLVTRTATAAAESVLGTSEAVETASIFAWGLAFLLFMLPHSIIAVSLVTAVFTPLARAAREGDTDTVRRRATATVRVLLVTVTLPAAGLVAFGPEVTTLLFGSRAAVAGPVVALMALGLPAFSSSYLVQRIFYAYDDGRTPFTVHATVALLWALGIVAVRTWVPAQWWVPGIAAAMTVAQVVGFALALGLAQRRVGGLQLRGIAWTAARVVLLGVVLVPVARFVAGLVDAGAGDRLDAAVSVLLGGGVLVFGYVLGCRLLRVRELAETAAPLLGRLSRVGGTGSRRG